MEDRLYSFAVFTGIFFPQHASKRIKQLWCIPSAVDQNEAVTSGATWPAVEGKSTHDFAQPSLYGNANNCGMAFEDDFMSNVAINKDMVPLQHLSKSKARAEAELIAEVCRDLGSDELDLNMHLECLELGPLTVNMYKTQFTTWTVKIIMWVISLSLARIEARLDAKNIL